MHTTDSSVPLILFTLLDPWDCKLRPETRASAESFPRRRAGDLFRASSRSYRHVAKRPRVLQDDRCKVKVQSRVALGVRDARGAQ
jgi:hypothetical protein